jgi:hypothetical protein
MTIPEVESPDYLFKPSNMSTWLSNQRLVITCRIQRAAAMADNGRLRLKKTSDL